MSHEGHSYQALQAVPLDSSRLQNLALLSDEVFWEYARELAGQIATAEYPEEYLECLLPRGSRLIPLNTLYEVVVPPHLIAVLPAMPPWMPGIVAWRGESIAVIDLESYLAQQPVALAHDGYEGTLLIASYEGLPVALLVSGVGEIRQNVPYEVEVHSAEEQEEALIIDVSSMLAEALRHIGTATSYG